ncbi:MAG TPA: insulinase family protein [Pseudonocardiaceae bacterium]|nr:insulinase family protein [Pseudonocardiaceae bacterium]
MTVERQRDRTLQTVCLTFGRGQRDEPEALPGLAHLVEHLVHCRRTFGSGRFFADLRAAGAVCNAYTGADYVQFWVSLPPAELTRWAGVMRRQLTDPVHEPSTVRRELDVIAQEVASKVTRHPHRGFSFHHNRSALFDDYPNAHTGFVDNPALRDLTPDETHRWFRFFLDPAVAAVATVGPLPTDQATTELAPVLEALAAPAAEPLGARPHRLAGWRAIRIERAGDSPPAGAVCFPVVRADRWLTDLAVHQVVAAILAQGGGRSLLGRRAPAGTTVTARVGIHNDANEDRSPTCLTVESTGDVEWLPAAVSDALGGLADGVDPAVVAAAARFVHTGALMRFDRPVPRARSITWLSLFHDASVDEYLAGVSSVGADQVALAAKALTHHGGREITL